jgi:hypothetical protein
VINSRGAVGNDLTLTHFFYSSEAPIDADGNVTVTVTRADGTALTGGTVASNNGTVGAYDFVLTAATHTNVVDQLTVTWAAEVNTGTVRLATQYVDIIGSRYFDLVDLRNMQGLDSETRYETADLEWARTVAEVQIERYVETAYSRQYAREIQDGNLTCETYVNRLPTWELRSVSIDGTLVADLTGWTLTSTGRIRSVDGGTLFTCTVEGQNVIIDYEYGYDFPPADLGRAALRYARHVLLTEETTIPDRARMLQTEIGLFHLDAASEDSPTGLPEVDSILVRYRNETPASFA